MSRGAARQLAWLLLLALGASSAGCRQQPKRELPGREPYIALERDFQDFESWTKVDLSHRPAVGATHAAGEAHEYINQMPPAGAKTFPVGTILVKTVKAQPKAEGKADAAGEPEHDPRTHVFAMVKRGAGYNHSGSPGWEWFELRRREDDSLGIVWRGINPPNSEGYLGDPAGGCNSCHQMAIKNDYVHATALALTKI
jgi:hypothetical protein